MRVTADPVSGRRDSDQEHLTVVVSEFCALADHLAMPIAERVGIAGLTEAEWHRLDCGAGDLPLPHVKTCLRRLTYSLPLLRKLANADDSNPPPQGRSLPRDVHAG